MFGGIDLAGDWRERFDDAVDLVIVMGLVTRSLPSMILDDAEMNALNALAHFAAKELRAIRRDFDGGAL